MEASLQISKQAQFFQHLRPVCVKFAALDEFPVVFPPIQQTAVFRFLLVGQKMVYQNIIPEKVIIEQPSFFVFHSICFEVLRITCYISRCAALFL